jgi:ascorbate-specific PTS system EIIC-type component UlaA
VVVCGIAFMAVGFGWYRIFGGQWSKYTGWTREKVAEVPQNQMVMSYGITFITALVSVFVLAGLLHLTKTTTYPRSLAIAGVVWLGFTAAPALSSTIFEHRPWGLWAIVTGNTLVSLLISAVILCAWR